MSSLRKYYESFPELKPVLTSKPQTFLVFLFDYQSDVQESRNKICGEVTISDKDIAQIGERSYIKNPIVWRQGFIPENKKHQLKSYVNLRLTFDKKKPVIGVCDQQGNIVISWVSLAKKNINLKTPSFSGFTSYFTRNKQKPMGGKTRGHRKHKTTRKNRKNKRRYAL